MLEDLTDNDTSATSTLSPGDPSGGGGGPFRFTVADYAVFGGALCFSALTGLYCGCRKGKGGGGGDPPAGGAVKEGEERGGGAVGDYLTGGRKFKPLPVAASLVASYVSGVTILGTPSEIYRYGSQYWLIVVAIWLMGLVVANVFLPVFSVLKVESSYEYLELRFSSLVRTLASILFVIDEILFLPIVIYVPALAFNQVTGVDVHVIGSVVCVVCIFYTVLGGLRAVVWSDTWQTLVMFCSVVLVCVLGTLQLGGTANVFREAKLGGRLEFFNFNPSPYERHTVWSVLIGGFVYWTSFNSVNQTMVQRYMSLPDLRKAKISVYLFTIGISLFVSLCCYSGLLVYAEYSSCDPLSAGLVANDDQLLPGYVMRVSSGGGGGAGGGLPGVPGLFVAGVFGAALSSLSVILHCTSGVLLSDVLAGCCGVRPRPVTSAWLLRGAAAVLGAATLASLYVVEHLGGVLSLASSLSAIAAGTTFGVFALGMLFPWATNRGALAGALGGALVTAWAALGAQAEVAAGRVRSRQLPVRIDGCESETGNVTLLYSEIFDEDESSSVFPLYRISYHWVSPLGVATVLIVGLLVSYVTGPNDPARIDPELISPVLHRFLPTSSKQYAGKTRKARMKIRTEIALENDVAGDKITYLTPLRGTNHGSEVR